jgi:hypothetical protein
MSDINQLEILKLTYCGFSAKIIETNKVVYCWKFPPAVGTTQVPNLKVVSNSSDLVSDSHVRKETFEQFVKSNQTRQVNGLWKGGAWGINNFTVTSENWFPGMYVGNKIHVQLMHQGIVKHSQKPFDGTETIISNTENCALSCNGIWNEKPYAFYMTDNIMPQRATDKLWMWGNKSSLSLRIKVMTRGSGADVDCPSRIAPTAGEHLEPGQSDEVRAQVLFAINQEIGIPESTLSQCYLLSLGTYADSGRDPRYWKYSAIQDGVIVEFGIARESLSVAHILYIETTDDVAPEETEQEDKKEIKAKRWENVNSIFQNYPESEWMLEDHMRFIPDSIKCIESFKQLSSEEKAKLKF